MSKGSGGTRISSWRDAIKDSVSATDRVSFIASHIDKYYEPDIDAVLAFDSLTDTERDKLLGKINFSGLVWDDEFYGNGGSLAISCMVEKNLMFDWIDEYAYYNKPDGDSTYTIGYADGTERRYDEWTEKAKRKIRRSDAIYAFGGGIAQGQYWATEAGYKAMAKIANFSLWKNGKKSR